MEKIKNLSIRKTIILYMLINLFFSFVIYGAILVTATKTQEQIWMKYIDKDKYYEAVNNEGKNFDVKISRVSRNTMNRIDGEISELCDFLETYSFLIISTLGTILMVWLFYRNKVQVPLSELKDAAAAVGMNDLDFSISYSNKDELGQLCDEFEKMRRQLEENNKQMWKMIEQEKALKSAVAHDIRSPLAILKGYQEMLIEFVPKEAIGKNKIMEMLREGMQQIERMEQFLDTMKKLSNLEDRSIRPEKTDLSALVKQYRKNAEILAKHAGKECEVLLKTDGEQILIDEGVVSEVMENLLGNALRYAKNKVNVLFSVKNENLMLEVRDDGYGFKEDERVLTKPYYHSNPQDDLKHFGMGLYICRVYCEKHGGKLLLENREGSGGSATALFHIGGEKDWTDE